MTNNLHEVLNANPGTVDALIKLMTALLAVNPVILIACVSFVALVIKRNTTATKTNTVSTDAIKPAIAAHETKLVNTQAAIDVSVKDFKKTIDDAKGELLTELTKIKIVVAKVNKATDDKLSGIPRVQDALAELKRQQSITDHNLNLLIEGLKKRTENKQ